MTGKEIVLKAMRFEETPRLPVAIFRWIRLDFEKK